MCQICFQSALMRLQAGEVLKFSAVAADPAPGVQTGETPEPEVAVAENTPIAPPAVESKFKVDDHNHLISPEERLNLALMRQ